MGGRDDKTFVSVTNKDIYRELIDFKEKNNSAHFDIIRHLENTNGKVKRSLWMATTAMTLIIAIILFFMQHISK